MCQRKRYFTLINRKGQIKFTGTADDAVTKGISVSQSAFRMVVQTFVDGKLLKTPYPYDENFRSVSNYALKNNIKVKKHLP